MLLNVQAFQTHPFTWDPFLAASSNTFCNVQTRQCQFHRTEDPCSGAHFMERRTVACATRPKGVLVWELPFLAKGVFPGVLVWELSFLAKGVFPQTPKMLQRLSHTPSIAFRHLPPNSARFSYATKGALFISAQLFTEAASVLRKVWAVLMTSQCRSNLMGSNAQTAART